MSHPGASSGLLVLLAALALPVGPAWAEDLATALRLEDAGRLSEALAAFEQVLTQPGNTQPDLASIYLHLGLLRFASSDTEGARQALEMLLGVDSDAVLPSSAPPELSEVFVEASRRWSGRSLHADIDWPERVADDGSIVVRVHVVNDVPGLVAAAALVVDGRPVCDAWGAQPFELVLTETEAASGEQVAVVLLNEHDGVVWSSPSVTSSRWTSSGPTAPSERSYRGLRIAGWTLLVAGALSIVAGGVLVGLDGQPTGETREDAIEVYTFGTEGWILIGLGGASLITGIVLLAVRRGGREPAGAGATASGRRGCIVCWSSGHSFPSEARSEAAGVR